jgi:G:T-mismatch repair DNA endonuclease (very short patch repair protein)
MLLLRITSSPALHTRLFYHTSLALVLTEPAAQERWWQPSGQACTQLPARQGKVISDPPVGYAAVVVWRCSKAAIAEVSHGEPLGANALSFSFAQRCAMNRSAWRMGRYLTEFDSRDSQMELRGASRMGRYAIRFDSRDNQLERGGANCPDFCRQSRAQWTSTCTYSCSAARSGIHMRAQQTRLLHEADWYRLRMTNASLRPPRVLLGDDRHERAANGGAGNRWNRRWRLHVTLASFDCHTW